MNGYITKIFVLCMVLGAFGVGAAAAAPAVTISPASTTGLAPGDTFSINIDVDPDGNGVASGQIDLSFDTAVLEVTGLAEGDMLGADPFDTGSAYDNTAGTVIAVLARNGATTPPTVAGTWATVTFNVKTGAVDGATTIAITSVGMVDESFADITGIITTDGTATVGAAAPAPAVTISPASTTGLTQGDTFSINIDVDPDGNGVASGQIDLSFDTAVLEVTGLAEGDMLGADPFDTGSAYDNTAGTVIAVLARNGATTPPTVAGTWATVTFNVKTGAVDGATTIAITSVGMVDESFADITGITTTDGTATVGEAGAVTLTWQTEPPASVAQGDDVTFDVSFSESVDYYFRIENSASEEVWRYPTTGTNTAANPTSKTWPTTSETPPGDYILIVNIDGVDNVDTKTVTVTEAGGEDTTDPTISSVTLNPTSTVPGGPVTVTVVATDASGIVSVTANGTTGTVTLTAQGSNTWQGAITAPSTDGTYTVTVVATDNSANVNTATDTSKSFTVAADATAPTISSVTLNPTSTVPGGPVTVTVVATDASGIVSVTANGTTGTVTLTSMGNDEWQGTITAPSTDGTYAVTVVATDASPNANERIDTSESFTVCTDSCTITLSTTGYTLIAMPLNDPGISTASDLANRIAGCTEVVKYDETTGAFVSYVPGNPLNDFAIVKGRGYFVNGATDSSVTFYGSIWT
ncbi:MAG: cohesin domain-containing protein [Euryarchaeota archaeon]|nr:cohesin domain-containing protein [Euryarchaeota archaeon]